MLSKEHFAVDEQIVSSKGRSNIKQYNLKTAHKWGYNILVSRASWMELSSAMVKESSHSQIWKLQTILWNVLFNNVFSEKWYIGLLIQYAQISQFFWNEKMMCFLRKSWQSRKCILIWVVLWYNNKTVNNSVNLCWKQTKFWFCQKSKCLF